MRSSSVSSAVPARNKDQGLSGRPERTASAVTKQTYTQCRTQYICYDIRKLRASCGEINLQEFNRKADASGNENRNNKVPVNGNGLSCPEIDREEEPKGDKPQNIGQDIHPIRAIQSKIFPGWDKDRFLEGFKSRWDQKVMAPHTIVGQSPGVFIKRVKGKEPLFF